MTGAHPEVWTITEIVGRFRNASNATLLAATASDRLVVYKPEQGQRPLWDFDCRTLPAREILTFEVSEAAGLPLVPVTLPAEGPFGPGSAQEFIDIDYEFNPAPLIDQADPQLWPVAVLDLVINNADRKAGHVLNDRSGRLWCIDHGVAFHTDPKLRTVMWGFSGLPFPADATAALRRLDRALGNGLWDRTAELLSEPEADALADRVRSLEADPVHPFPPTDRPPLPWPLW